MSTHARPLRIGLTGGIGSGKSTVAHILQKHGAALLDADAIARSLTAPQGLAMPAIADAFGTHFVDADGALNRPHMRAHVFAHPDAKQALEAILHPLILSQIQQQAQQAVAAGHSMLVYDIPLLVESGTRWLSQVDRVLVVDCTQETQIQRVMARSQLSREVAQGIIAAQVTREKRLIAADWVVYNDQISLSTLEQQILMLIHLG